MIPLIELPDENVYFLFSGVSETSPLHQYNLDVGEDDVFMVSFRLWTSVQKQVSGDNGPVHLLVE